MYSAEASRATVGLIGGIVMRRDWLADVLPVDGFAQDAPPPLATHAPPNAPPAWLEALQTAPQTALAGPPPDATPDQMLWVTGIGGGNALVQLTRDGAALPATAQLRFHQGATDDPGTPTTAEGYYRPVQVVFDPAHDRFFVADSDGTNDRILQGSLSGLLSGAAPNLTVLWSEATSETSSSIVGLQLDVERGFVYFGVNRSLWRVNYDTPAQTGVEVVRMGVFVTDFVLDIDAAGNATAYLISSGIGAGGGADTISANYILRATGIAPGDTDFSGNPAVILNMAPQDNEFGTLPNPLFGEAFPKEHGVLRSIRIDPVTKVLYFTTGSWVADHDSNSGTPPVRQFGGVWSYATVGNPTGVYTNIYRQDGATGPLGFLWHLALDTTNGRYFVSDRQGGPAADDEGVWVGSLSGGTPTLFATVAGGGLTPFGLDLETAPTLTATGTTATFTEAPGTAVQPLTGPDATDVDSVGVADALRQAQVRFTAGYVNGTDQLLINGATSGTIELGANDIAFSFNATTGVLTLTGVQSLAQYEAALALVRYRALGDDPTAGAASTSRTLAYSVFDGLLWSDERAATVTVLGSNDAPTAVATGLNPGFTEGGAAVDLFSGVTLATVETGQLIDRLVLTVSNVASGTETLSIDGSVVALVDGASATTAGSALSVAVAVAAGLATVTLVKTGGVSAAAMAAVIDGLAYRAPGDAVFTGTRAVTLTSVRDTGGVANGGADTATVSLTSTVAVTGVNDAPTANPDTAGVLSFASVSGNVLTNDADPDSSLTVSAGGTVSGIYGQLSLGANGAWTYDANNAADVLAGETVTDVFAYTASDGSLTSASTLTLSVTGRSIGGTGNDRIIGNGSANALSGLEGDDTLTGGGGNDTLTGGAGDDRLDGGVGVDRMVGGTGDDRYEVDDNSEDEPPPTGPVDAPGTDEVVELPGEGTDVIVTTVSFTIAANVEAMRMQGTGLLGVGSDAGELLVSAGGANTLEGRGGSDVYVVNTTGDVVIETVEGGTYDIVIATADYARPANVELLRMRGAGLTGTGTSGADVLESEGGGNALAGLGGDDVYLVRGTGDAVLETASGGADIVFAFISYTIPANVETLFLRGAGLTGTGSAGGDVLVSEGGANTLTGGDGDDSYGVNALGDVVTEAANAGYDIVHARVSRTIDAHVEALVVIGGGLTATGGIGGDTLVSVGGGNTLTGGGGDDYLLAGDRADALTGGPGGDAFAFRGLNGALLADRFTVTDFDAATGDGIDLRRIDAIAGGGDDAFTVGALANGQAGRLQIDQVSASLYRLSGDVDGDGVADFMLDVTIAAGGTWSAGSIFL